MFLFPDNFSFFSTTSTSSSNGLPLPAMLTSCFDQVLAPLMPMFQAMDFPTTNEEEPLGTIDYDGNYIPPTDGVASTQVMF